jgi:hypothetical protein
MKRAPGVVRTAVVALTGLASVLASGAAIAFPEYPGTRALGMGGAGRADARGNEGPLLNPAGMSLARIFTLEGGYQLITRDGGHLVHASVVDSRTSDWNLAGGLYYTYKTASPAGVPRLSGHEAGLALSIPLLSRVMVGATGKYFHVSGGAPEADGAAKHQGFTLDAGLVVRAASVLTVGVAGYNLRNLSTASAPVALGYGVAVNPAPTLVLVADVVHDFTAGDDTRGVEVSAGGGAELSLAQRVTLRAGGGRDGRSRRGFITAGVAAAFELGAIDAGVRQDVSGGAKQTYLAIGLRLFVPSSPFGPGP